MSAFERMKAKMQLLGIEPKRSLGQNFLISDSVIEKICTAVADLQSETLYEVGPGLGALTDLLREKNSFYHLIELDRVFAKHWRDEGFPVIEEDALRIDWGKLPRKSETGRRVLVSNLPYQISSSLLIERCLDDERLSGMVLMFQKEVAQRIRALPRTSDYGLLSVIAQAFWEIDFLLEASGQAFSPPPKVASRVLVFRFKSSRLRNPEKFLRFVKAGFSQRRKLLIKNLVGQYGGDLQHHRTVFEKLQINDKARAEELSVDLMIDLFQNLGYDLSL